MLTGSALSLALDNLTSSDRGYGTSLQRVIAGTIQVRRFCVSLYRSESVIPDARVVCCSARVPGYGKYAI